MSYDYMLVRAPAELAGASITDENLEAALMAFADALSGPPIGSLDEVKAALQKLFPTLRWRQMNLEFPAHLLLAEVGDWSWSSVGQADHPDFHLGLDGASQVRIIGASRAEPDELQRIAGALGLLVLDEQTLEMLTG